MSSTPRESSHPPEAKHDKRAATPTMMERMRALFGLGAVSIRDDIEDALEDSEAGVFSPQERAMLKNVLDLHEIRVEDIMVPRADMIAVGLSASLRDVLDVFRDAGHSRLPVHGDTLDEPKGMVHIRDFVHHVTAPQTPGQDTHADGALLHLDLSPSLEATGVMRPVLFVPPSMQALDLLVRMQATRTHMALVIDEFGGTDGLVTIEDIVEMIVGDIEDEHDEDESPKILVEADGTFIADARATLDDVSTIVGVSIATAEDEDDVDTLGGLVTALAGHLPNPGEIVTGNDGADFEVMIADARRVIQVRVRLKRSPAGADVTDLPSGIVTE